MMSNTPISLSGSDKPTMLLVLGPDRSGTSLIARLLECLGGVNSKNLMPPNAGNPTGYFEDLDIYHFNDRVLLPQLGLTWYSLRFPEWSSLDSSIRADLEQQALEIIHKNYFSLPSSLFILKEPRINTLLPFWLPVLDRAGINVKIIGALRDPWSVANSLKKQHGFSITHGGLLYATKWFAALTFNKNLPITFTSFDGIFIDPLKSLQLIADQLQLALPSNVKERVEVFTNIHFDEKLRNFYLNKKNTLLDISLPFVVVKIYKTLLNAFHEQEIEEARKTIGSMAEIFSTAQPLLEKFDNIFNQYRQEFTHVL